MADLREEEIVNLAVAYFRGGLYCSEAILAAFNEVCELHLSEEVRKIATGFGTGFGGARCVCGSITGAQMVISLLKGRSHPQDSEIPAFEAAKFLHDAFKKEFKASCCRILTKDVTWGAPEHHASCEKYVAYATHIAYQLIKEDI